jgi:hypothetical protein
VWQLRDVLLGYGEDEDVSVIGGLANWYCHGAGFGYQLGQRLWPP